VCTVFLDRISSFQRRSDASNISLLFDAQQHNDEQESSFAGLGYHLTPPANPPQGGHGGYYAIVSCPAVSNRSNSRDIQSRLNVFGGPGPARLMGPLSFLWPTWRGGGHSTLYQRIRQYTLRSQSVCQITIYEMGLNLL